MSATEATLPPQIQPLTPKKRAGKLTPFDIEAIAIKVAKKRLTEAEACHLLEIRPQQWYAWKSRAKNQGRFESVCARIRGAAIENAVDRIEAAGVKDWRADEARLKIIDRERFGDHSQTTVIQQDSQTTLTMLRILDKLWDQRNKPLPTVEAQSQIIDAQPELNKG